ncbi:hypothetical protein LCGC14_1676590 [marine sediment metagenome]|uniref:Uncharacterized protein n=1 Tax=marine sediment metagenome TaxID=412755 RepID=A0A0F9IC79_9ZZZZ
MTFLTMQIAVSLSVSMKADIPKSGEAEIQAIDKHSDAIDRIVDSRLHEIAQDLISAGYTVEIDESV